MNPYRTTYLMILAVIIGGFIYLGMKNSNFVVAPRTEKVETRPLLQSVEVGSLPASRQVSISPQSAVACGAGDNTIVTKVIDGDTVVVEGGEHVRLLGMDADEKNYPCYLPSKNRLEELVLGKQVLLEKDKTDLDQYGRCLRYIFIGDTNIDVQLVKEGLAIARFYEPDVKYKAEITAAEKQAQTSGLGCEWSNRPAAQ